MQDLKLNLGDLSAIYQGKDEQGNSIYDIEMYDGVEGTLLRRSLETPYSYLKLWSYPGLSSIDEDFGNKIYQHLSDPLSAILSSNSLAFINQALTVPKLYVDIIDLSVESSSINTLSISLTYKLKDTNQVESITLSI